MVSIATKESPMAIEGLASGKDIRRKLSHGEHLSKRADCNKETFCSIKEARQSKYTYGYKTNANTKMAPGRVRMSGNQ